MKIQLEIEEHPDIESLEKGILSNITRIFCKIRFKTKTGWTEHHKAIIDTGSPYSVIPFDLSKEIEIKKLYPTSIKGIVTQKDAFISATFAKTKCILFDETNISQIFDIEILISRDQKVPIILGFSGVLNKTKLIIDFPLKRAYLEY
jgi:hypothetical protein